MSQVDRIPRGVLSDQLTEKLAGRRIRSALFTTYSFDPGFFELEILPLLFEQPFDHREKLKRVQLEDALRAVNHVAVYYDRSALSQDASPATLDFRRIDVRRTTGAFHPKLVLLLVDNEIEEVGESLVLPSLIVGLSSANLTRAGWWENLEAAHFEEIAHREFGERTSYRTDLLGLLKQLRRSTNPEDDHGALEAIEHFLRRESTKASPQYARAQGRWHTRIFWGQQDLPTWLADLRLGGHDWNLEIISPYFDAHPESTISALTEVLAPRETRVFLPVNPDASAAVTQEVYETIGGYAKWSHLPAELLRRSGSHREEAALPRFVHAKIYRLWNRTGQDLALIGSVNLTRPAHSPVRQGNLEAAFLVDLSEMDLPRRWWLRPNGEEPAQFTEKMESDEREDAAQVIDLTLRYDWVQGTLAYRYEGTGTESIELCQSDGPHIHTIQNPCKGAWEELPKNVADQVASLLHGSSFLLLRRGSTTWRVLVREEGLSHRPSLLSQLTPEEILHFWSLLTPEQRAAFIEKRLVTDASLEGLAPAIKHDLGEVDSIFDRYAGLYHAFGQLNSYVRSALAEDREEEVVTRLMGAKYDSLPVLLERTWEDNNADPVQRYLTFLCAQQVWKELRSQHREFVRRHQEAAASLKRWLKQVPQLRSQLPFPSDQERRAFLRWYEREFLKRAQAPKDAA